MTIPSTSQRFLDPRGNIDADWRRWLEKLDKPRSIAELQELVAQLQTQLDEIGDGQRVVAQFSIQGAGDDTYYLTLVNDQIDPGPTYHYATGPDGIKGWWPVAEAFAPGENITLDTDADTGVTTISASSGATPYFIAEASTFRVPEFIQSLFSMPIDVEGTLEVDGYLIGVD